ncbi:MAG TPA: enoyl-CoA hydratase/isomerase family protein [Burkholderiales bacterium]|nr:enoyl-CoA hydratase/isomerase family protein [Burkholderiales bacterium]
MSEISVKTANGACRIELNRPECGNLVTSEMVAALSEVLRGIGSDVKLVVIAGGGPDFCKGRDYQAAPESATAGRATPSALAIRERMTGPMVSLYGVLRDLPVATLSVVQGAAYGFGCALAGACDMTLAADSARFRLPEMGRGLPPTLAMSALWDRLSPRTIGYLVYSTAELSASDALAIGLANSVVPGAELDARAAALVGTICNQPLDAIRAVKEYLKEAPAMPASGRGGFGASLFAGVLSSR